MHRVAIVQNEKRNWLVSTSSGVAAHANSGAAGMHPRSCWTRGGPRRKQWRKSCIVAARIVSRKAVTLSSGSCVLPALPLAARTPRRPPFCWFQGWLGPSNPGHGVCAESKYLPKFRLPSIIFPRTGPWPLYRRFFGAPLIFSPHPATAPGNSEIGTGNFVSVSKDRRY